MADIHNYLSIISCAESHIFASWFSTFFSACSLRIEEQINHTWFFSLGIGFAILLFILLPQDSKGVHQSQARTALVQRWRTAPPPRHQTARPLPTKTPHLPITSPRPGLTSLPSRTTTRSCSPRSSPARPRTSTPSSIPCPLTTSPASCSSPRSGSWRRRTRRRRRSWRPSSGRVSGCWRRSRLRCMTLPRVSWKRRVCSTRTDFPANFHPPFHYLGDLICSSLCCIFKVLNPCVSYVNVIGNKTRSPVFSKPTFLLVTKSSLITATKATVQYTIQESSSAQGWVSHFDQIKALFEMINTETLRKFMSSVSLLMETLDLFFRRACRRLSIVCVFLLSAHNCQVPTPTSQNLEVEQKIRIFGADGLINCLEDWNPQFLIYRSIYQKRWILSNWHWGLTIHAGSFFFPFPFFFFTELVNEQVLEEGWWPAFLDSWSLQLSNDSKMSPQHKSFFAHCHIYNLWCHPALCWPWFSFC